MCIRIINSESEVKYNASIPLEHQLNGGERIVVKYERKDPDIGKFVREIERLSKNGISANINVEVLYSDDLQGAKTKKLVKKLVKDLDVNEVIKLLANFHHTSDKILGELAIYCQKR